jgi:hypothetical protein
MAAYTPAPSSNTTPVNVTINLPQSNTVYYLKIQPVDGSGAVFTGLSELTVTSK